MDLFGRVICFDAVYLPLKRFYCTFTVFVQYLYCIFTVFLLYFYCIFTVFLLYFYCITVFLMYSQNQTSILVISEGI